MNVEQPSLNSLKWRVTHGNFNSSNGNEYLLKGKLGKLKNSLKSWISQKGQTKWDGGNISYHDCGTREQWKSKGAPTFFVYQSPPWIKLSFLTRWNGEPL